MNKKDVQKYTAYQTRKLSNGQKITKKYVSYFPENKVYDFQEIDGISMKTYKNGNKLYQDKKLGIKTKYIPYRRKKK